MGRRRPALRQLGGGGRRQGIRPDVRPLDGQGQRPLPAALGLRRCRPRCIAREGWKIPNYITLAYANSESWPGLYRSNTVYLQTSTKDSLPVFSNLTFRLEKKIAIGTGRMYLMADVFNALNSAVVNRAYDAYFGVYYVDTEASSANPSNRLYNEVLNPRVWRFGLRFEF